MHGFLEAKSAKLQKCNIKFSSIELASLDNNVLHLIFRYATTIVYPSGNDPRDGANVGLWRFSNDITPLLGVRKAKKSFIFLACSGF